MTLSGAAAKKWALTFRGNLSPLLGRIRRLTVAEDEFPMDDNHCVEAIGDVFEGEYARRHYGSDDIDDEFDRTRSLDVPQDYFVWVTKILEFAGQEPPKKQEMDDSLAIAESLFTARWARGLGHLDPLQPQGCSASWDVTVQNVLGTRDPATHALANRIHPLQTLTRLACMGDDLLPALPLTLAEQVQQARCREAMEKASEWLAQVNEGQRPIPIEELRPRPRRRSHEELPDWPFTLEFVCDALDLAYESGEVRQYDPLVLVRAYERQYTVEWQRLTRGARALFQAAQILVRIRE